MRTWLRQRHTRLVTEESGFGLIELMISMVILAVAIAGLLAIFGAGAFSLARAGHIGTASAIMDRNVEYYRRAPWSNIHLVTTAVTPNPAAAGRNYGSTAAAGDSEYTTQCSCPGSEVGYVSAVPVDSGALSTLTVALQPQLPAALQPVSTCAAPAGSPGQPTYDSQAPPTWCAAEYDLRGPDNDLYRVYTYMRFGCIDGYAGPAADCPADNGTTVKTDFKTKIVTIIIRLLKPNGTLANSTATGILAKETLTLNYNSYINL